MSSSKSAKTVRTTLFSHRGLSLPVATALLALSLSACINRETMKADYPPDIADVQASTREGFTVSDLKCRREADDLFNCDFVVRLSHDRDAVPIGMNMKYEMLKSGKWRVNMTR